MACISVRLPPGVFASVIVTTYMRIYKELGDLHLLSERCRGWFRSSGMWSVGGWVAVGASKDRSAFIFKGIQSSFIYNAFTFCTPPLPWRLPVTLALTLPLSGPLRHRRLLPHVLRLAGLHLLRCSYRCTLYCVSSAFALSSWTD